MHLLRLSIILIIFLSCSCLQQHGLLAQQKGNLPACEIASREVDPFDSLLTIASKTVSLGMLIPSLYEEADGPKLIEEAKAIVTFTQNDSIDCFFLHIVMPEYTLQPIEQGFNVKAIIDDTTVVSFLNFPDQGQFDRKTLMHTYQHSCVIPLDMYYRLAYQKITKIRIEYTRHRRTFALSEEQQLALRRAFQCVGIAAGLYPQKS
jgi:hypothetical protein